MASPVLVARYASRNDLAPIVRAALDEDIVYIALEQAPPQGRHVLQLWVGPGLMGAVTAELLLRSRSGAARQSLHLLAAGAACLLAGTLLGLVAVPIVKRIWTPSWVLFSGGWVLLFLAAFHWLVEARGHRRLVFPLVVVGMNSLFIYLMHSLCAGWMAGRLKVHLGDAAFAGTWGPVAEKLGVLAVLWLLCYWLYRQRAFLRL